jgi:hypothetical protein
VALGEREKAILLLMFQNDDPPGKPNALWFDIYREFEIDYNSLPKKYQAKYQQERKFRRTIYRLMKKDLMRALSFLSIGGSLPDPRGFGYSFYCLTPKGRKIAEKLLFEKNKSNSYEDFKKALDNLRIQGYTKITINDVYESMWPLARDKFRCREDFEKFWNPHKIGSLLKKQVIKRSHISMKDGRITYLLRVNDLI